MKKKTVIINIILLIWFGLDLVGISIGDFTLTSPVFISKPFGLFWWIMYAILLLVFIKTDAIGKFLLLLFLTIWGYFQYAMYFFSTESGIAKYNHYFSNTHHLFDPSSTHLVKDTYHIFLDILILLALITTIMFILKSKKRKHK